MSVEQQEAKHTGAPVIKRMSSIAVGSEVRIVRSNRVVLDNIVCSAEIVITNGTITRILPRGGHSSANDAEVLDVGNLVVMPGVIDPHVHVNEPGRVAWEGYWTATRAAAAGGITTMVDMPLNSLPPTTTVSNFQTKLQAADGQCFVDMAFWGGVVPENQAELRPMLKAGIPGFKCFLISSGVDEFPCVSLMDLHKVMVILQGTESILLFHAELDNTQGIPASAHTSEYSMFLESRPDIMEVDAIRTIIDLCLLYKVKCHIVHLSSAQALPIIREARRAGAPITVETTHHYLTLDSDNIPPGATHYKCCPPIRKRINQEELWAALHDGHIDMVVSDHSPCTPDLKLQGDGDFLKAWGGISSLQFGLPLFWTAAACRGFGLHDVVRLMCANPAKLCRLEERKGALRPGWDADMVIWDPDKEFEVQEHMIHHKHKLTPYLGFHLRGQVFASILRGTLIYQDGNFCPLPCGDHILIQSKSSDKGNSPYY
ncbi:allantoinase, mitochondrial-like [Ambystoma mexicanum]|uniref:allantoinase, mitochondrial-like n=1 Tax=Ambystoma mexicanum TaxID=8296 RepID=UPI0037E7DD9B